MRWAIASLVLNESEWLPYLYRQHKDFPGLVKWIFVESADKEYARANPHLVNNKGLSVDDTSSFLQEIARKDERVEYIPFGFSEHQDPAQGKCQCRNAYLEVLDKYDIDYLLILDGDEFWTHHEQKRLEGWVTTHKRMDAFTFPHREIWYPPFFRNNGAPLFDYEVVGGFWEIVINRVWKYSRGMRHTNNHNTPYSAQGRSMKEKMLLYYDRKELKTTEKPPEFIHLGFAAKPEIRCAKNKYYEDRGEKTDPHRSHYTVSRGMWATWNPSQKLPEGAKVVPYNGPVPEAFTEMQ